MSLTLGASSLEEYRTIHVHASVHGAFAQFTHFLRAGRAPHMRQPLARCLLRLRSTGNWIFSAFSRHHLVSMSLVEYRKRRLIVWEMTSSRLPRASCIWQSSVRRLRRSRGSGKLDLLGDVFWMCLRTQRFAWFVDGYTLMRQSTEALRKFTYSPRVGGLWTLRTVASLGDDFRKMLHSAMLVDKWIHVAPV